MPKVSLVRCEDYEHEHVEAALEAALAPFDGLSFVKPGMRIGIKTNLIIAKAPSAAATTHPEMLAALCRLIRARGAEPVVGDSPGGPFTLPYLKTIYSVTGLSAVERSGGVLNNNTAQRTEDFPEGVILKKVTYTDWLASCDAVVSFAKLKCHAMLGMTGAVKNLFGAVPGLMKAEFHSLYPKTEDFCNMLLDLNLFIRPSLALIDAVDAMEGNGPTAGIVRHMACVIASPSTFHAYVAAADLIGLSCHDLPLLEAAVKRGLAPEKAEDLELCGKLEDFRAADFKNIPVGGVSFGGKESSLVMRAVRVLLERRPQVDKAKCIGCGLCARSCPRKAIEIKNTKPRFHTSRCIRCFCCQELCTKEAISVKTTLLSKFLN